MNSHERWDQEDGVTSVNVFNATPDEITIEINNGPPLHVPGTGATSNWVPQQTEEVVLWSEYQKTAGQLNYDRNVILIRRAVPDGAAPDVATRIETLPMADQGRVNSLQLYVFRANGNSFSPVLLKDGVPVGVSRNLVSGPFFN